MSGAAGIFLDLRLRYFADDPRTGAASLKRGILDKKRDHRSDPFLNRFLPVGLGRLIDVTLRKLSAPVNWKISAFLQSLGRRSLRNLGAMPAQKRPHQKARPV